MSGTSDSGDAPDDQPRTNPFGGRRAETGRDVQARRSHPVESPPPASAIVAGTGLAPLPTERILRSIRRSGVEAVAQGEDHGLHLTTHRVIAYGQDRIFLLIPSGRRLRSALISDIDSTGTRTKRLPSWLLGLGAVLFVGGVIALLAGGRSDSGYSTDSNNIDQSTAILIMLFGGGMAVLWALVRRNVLFFSVAGVDSLEVGLLSVGGQISPEVGRFMSDFVGIKTGTATVDGEHPSAE